MKVMVTGGAGFIGSHLVDALIAQGYEVAIVDDLSTGRRQNLNPAARFYHLDIGDPALAEVFERERPDIVNHHAAQTSVHISVNEPKRDAEINTLGSLSLIENCRRFGVQKMIYISSGGAVYGEPVYLPCDEDHPINPLCPYGVSKHVFEHYLYLYRQLYGLNYTVLRYANIYGPRQDPYGEAGVVAIFALQMLEDRPVTINGSGEQQRDFVYVEDVVRCNLAALERGDGQTYNVGCGQGTTVNQIFARLKTITGYKGEPHYGPPKAGETFIIYLDATRAKCELGWEPGVGLEEGLARTVEYFRSKSNQ